VKIAAVILSLFLFLKPVIPFMEYAAFYEYIKTELCINQDKPELQCNGKCHLTKELAKVSNSENGSDKNQSISIEYSIVYFQNTDQDYELFSPKEQPLKVNTLYNNGYTYYYTNCVFHPPLV